MVLFEIWLLDSIFERILWFFLSTRLAILFFFWLVVEKKKGDQSLRIVSYLWMMIISGIA